MTSAFTYSCLTSYCSFPSPNLLRPNPAPLGGRQQHGLMVKLCLSAFLSAHLLDPSSGSKELKLSRKLPKISTNPPSTLPFIALFSFLSSVEFLCFKHGPIPLTPCTSHQLMQYRYTPNLIQLITSTPVPHRDSLLCPDTTDREGRGGLAAWFDLILSWNKLNLLVLATTDDNTPDCVFCLYLQQCHFNWNIFVCFKDAGAWTWVVLHVGGRVGGHGGTALMSRWPLWLQWKAQQGKCSLAWAQQSLLKLQKGWVATDGAVNNRSPTHANTSSCTKDTPLPHPMPYHWVETDTHSYGGYTDGKCVDRCVMLWRSVPGAIPLVFQPLNSINTSEKLLGWWY